MASTGRIENIDLGTILTAVKGDIRASVLRLPAMDPVRNIAVKLEGLTADEARSIIVKVLEIEAARGGAEAVLSPTEYGNRFSALDLD